jgi:carboxypeptidase C (cathepsin A)
LTAGKPYEDDQFLGDEAPYIWIHILQVEEMHLSTQGKQVIVADSGHMIPYQRPDAIISAIHEVWSVTKR